MTYLQDYSGNVIGLPDDFSHSKGCVSPFSFKIIGDYSVSFTVPKTAELCRIIGYFSPSQSNPVPAYTQVPFKLVREGNAVAYGYLLVEKDNGKELTLFFLGGNANWLGKLSGTLKDFDYEDYKMGADDSHFNDDIGGMVWPFADWATHGKMAQSNYFTYAFRDSGQNLFPGFYPCVYVKMVMREMLREFGIKLAGNLLNHRLYHQLVLTPDEAIPKRAPKFYNDRYSKARLTADQSAGGATSIKITFDSEIIDGAKNLYDPSTGKYTVDKAGQYTVKAVSTVTSTGGTLLNLYRNGVNYAPIWTGAGGTTYTGEITFMAAAGEYFEIYLQTSGAQTLKANSTIEISPYRYIYFPLDYYRASDILPGWSCADFVKSVIMYFNVVPSYNERTSTLTLNTLQSFQPSEAKDWSKYFVQHEFDFTKSSAKNNYLRFATVDDQDLQPYQGGKIKYGDANFPGANQSIQESDLFTFKWGAALDGITQNVDRMAMPIIDLAGLKDAQVIAYTSVTNSAGTATFNGTNFPKLNTNEIIRIVDDNGMYSGYAVVSAWTTTTIKCYNIAYVANSTGSIYRQSGQDKSGQTRLLYFTGYQAVSGLGLKGTTPITYSELTGFTWANVGFSYFAKGLTGLSAVDAFNQGLHLQKGNQTDGPMEYAYYGHLKNIINKPISRISLLLPEAEFHNFNFDTFIKIFNEDTYQYFFIESIEAYKGASDICIANGYLIR